MNQDVKYSGLTAVPADYECADGQLAVAINCVPENGALQPVLPPKQIKKITIGESGATALFIHKTNDFTHYIVRSGVVKIGWSDDKSNSDVKEFEEAYSFDEGNTIHFNALGNTLLIFTKTAIRYYLWKGENYTYLGDHVPDIGISFGLVGHPRLYSMSDDSKNTFTIDFAEGIADDNIYSTFSEKNKTRITEQVMARVNKFVANETVRKGRFCFPFFVRYALRLYDGSLVGHSVPILMNPSTTACPIVLWNRLSGKKSTYSSATLDIMLVAATLDYRLDCGFGDWVKLTDWKDIIKSVDVFISQPLYTFDQNGECTSFNDSNDFESRFIGRLFHERANTSSGFLQSTSAPQEDTIIGPVDSDGFLQEYAEWRYSHIYAFYFNQKRLFPSDTLHLPEFSDDKRLENLRNASTFYKLCSIDTQTLYNNRLERTDIKIEDEYLQSLVTREVMTDDYLSHDRLRASSSFTYNNRLNLGGVKRKLFSGFNAQSSFAYVSTAFAVKFNTDDNNKIIFKKLYQNNSNYITVFIKENGKEYRVSAPVNANYFIIRDIVDTTIWEILTYQDGKAVSSYSGRWKYHWPCYFFYPNVNAYRISITSNPAIGEFVYIDLKPHEFLNGAYAVLDYNHIMKDNRSDFEILPPTIPSSPDENQVVSVPNKVYTSEVNNPFFFPLLGINTVGTGEIKGICTAAKALSEGQFGQFPLYAFTTEGVWALEVSSTGTYSAKQPITRDVCINADGITQLDSAVLFPTDRGIMLISGSQTQCISEPLNSEFPFNALTSLPHFRQLHDMLGEPHTAADTCLPTKPFTEFLEQCRMIYDYVHQRIIVYAPGITYAYVYSLKSQQWGMTFSNIVSHLNSYPEAFAVDSDSNIVNFSESDAAEVGMLYVTRALKLGQGSLLKTVDTIIQRGNFARGNLATALYGSRDLINWYLVWSSKDHYLRGFRGTPYKYFRIAGVGHLGANENIIGASVQFTPRQTNQPR